MSVVLQWLVKSLLVLSFMFASNASIAQIYLCASDFGRDVYSDLPCDNSQNQQLINEDSFLSTIELPKQVLMSQQEEAVYMHAINNVLNAKASASWQDFYDRQLEACWFDNSKIVPVNEEQTLLDVYTTCVQVPRQQQPSVYLFVPNRVLQACSKTNKSFADCNLKMQNSIEINKLIEQIN